MDVEARNHALDSLRGLAAFTVVLSHFSLLPPLQFSRHGVLHFFTAGHEAVVLFFVLSGFVLSLQLTRQSLPYGAYVLKRVCRIYLPYAAVIVVAYAALHLFPVHVYHWPGSWLRDSWGEPTGIRDLGAHLAFIFPFNTQLFAPVIWSLVYEMRVSFFMPLILAVFGRIGYGAGLALALVLSLVSALATKHAAQTSIFWNSLDAGWWPTLHYVGMFAAGAAVMRYRTAISAYLGSSAARAAALLVSCGLYFLSGPLSYTLHALATHSWMITDLIREWMITLGCAGIIAVVVAQGTFSRVLRTELLASLGKISYSLYLTHGIVILAVLHAIGGLVSPWVSLSIAAVLILPVACASYAFIERPSMALGRRLAAGMNARVDRERLVAYTRA
jgi:peptidoglycan/LPS O-acetylase OafA/YrhL